ncbi:MAG: hypothetical protein HC872_02900 [Gammaproteobacteria bacterium]|nr:hypothetical protein [Gammaproteobacteria bacterium]
MTSSSTAAPTRPDAEPLTLEQILRQISSASGHGNRDGAVVDVKGGVPLMTTPSGAGHGAAQGAANATHAAIAAASSAQQGTSQNPMSAAALDAAFGAARLAAGSQEAGRSSRAVSSLHGHEARPPAVAASISDALGTARPSLDTDTQRRGNLLETPVRTLLNEVSFERASDTTQSFTIAAPNTAATTPATGGTPVRAETAVLQLNTPVTQPEWADGVSERVVWLTQGDVNNAQIRLNPAHLGPIEVQVNVNDDNASVTLLAHHATTREALESAAPRLREMLSAQGFTNVNIDINQQSAGQSAGQRSAQHEQRLPSWMAQRTAEESAADLAHPATTHSRTALDTFA